MNTTTTNLKDLRKKRDQLTDEVSNFREKYKNETDTTLEEQWKNAAQAKEIELAEIENQIHTLQGTIKNEFLQNIFNNRKKGRLPQHSEIFKIARKDAEETAFQTLILSPQEIAHFFSTDDCIIRCTDGNVRPKKFFYKWYVPLQHRKQNVIPLSPGIKVPKKHFPNGQVKDVTFTMERFYSDSKFIQYCQHYYDQFNLKIDITRDKNKQSKRFFIQLSLKNDGIITFDFNKN